MSLNLNTLRGAYNNKTISYLRYHSTTEWKTSCLKKAKYACEITGKSSSKKTRLTVHHLDRPFESIVKDAHKQLGIKFHKFVDQYDKSDMDALVKLIKEMHKDVQGIVLTSDIHQRIHDKFGKNPTQEQVRSYKKGYKSYVFRAKNSHYKNRTA